MNTTTRRRRTLLASLAFITTFGSTVTVAATPLTSAVPAAAVAPGTPPPFEVALTADGFVPNLITVVPGQSIVFSNESGAPRQISSDTNATFASGVVADGSRYVLAFPSTGTWNATDGAATPHTAAITVGQLTLPGAPLDSANQALPDTMAPDAPVIVHPALGILVTRNRILIGFSSSATVQQANAALAAAQLTIVGGNRDLSMLVTEIADAGTTSLDYMQSALDTLRAQPGVRTAAYDISIDPETALPRPVVPDPGSSTGSAPYTWEALVTEDETIRGDGSNFGLEAARFPQAWNWLDAIHTRAPGNSTKSSTIVLDNAFDVTHPDLVHVPVLHLCTPDNRCTDNRIGVDADGEVLSEHGTATAGIVGAAFDRGPASSPTSQGTVGGDPTSTLHLVPFFTDNQNDTLDTVTFASFLSVIDLILDEKGEAPFTFANLRVINLSAGFAFTENLDGQTTFEALFGLQMCGPGADDDETTPTAEQVACTPNTKDVYLKEFRAAAELVRPLANRLAANNVLLVVAAGNDGTTFCADRPRISTSAPCAQRATISTTNTDAFGYLASTWPAGSVPPWVLVEANETTMTHMERTPYSNNNGTISAGGRATVPFVDQNFVATYHLLNGTSMAAPYVTAAAGLLSALTPSWITVRRLLVERGPIDLNNSNTPRLDVFSSLIGLPSNVGIDALLDVNDDSPDGNRRVTRDDRNQPTGEDRVMGSTLKRTEWSEPDEAIDMRDFRRYRDAWLDFCFGLPGCPDQIGLDGAATHPKRDMNLDGCFAAVLPACGNVEGVYSRVDFNGDGTLLDREFPILIDAAGNPTARGAGSRMTDLDVLQTRFGQGSNANTEGWTAADLDALMVSADVELRLDRLWEGGALSAEVTVSTVNTTGPRRTLTPPGTGTGDIRVYSIPIEPVTELDSTDLIQVRVVGHMPGDTTLTYLSPPLEVKAGQDVVVVPCTSQLVVTSSPTEVAPGGSAFVSATLSDCTGRPVASSPIEFEISAGPNGSGLSAVEVLTDAQGIARTTFTYPEGVNSDAQVVARSYPAVDGGERLERYVDIGPAADLVIHYRFRQTILDYTRTSTNYWGTGQDDCVGGDNGSVKCFIATQQINTRFDLPINQFDLTMGELERTGTITPSGDGGATIDESVRSGQSQTSNTPDAFDLTGITLTTTVEEWDPASPDTRIFKIYDSPVQVSGQPSAAEFADLPPVDVPTIDFGITDSALLVNNLNDYGNGYAVLQAAYTLQRGYLILPEDTNPDLPIPNLYQPLQQIPTDLAFVPRADSSSLAWGWNPDGPLEFVGNGDGTYQPMSWCGTRERVFDNTDDPGYWNDSDPAIPTINPLDPNEIFDGPYRDPDDQRAERQDGDRAAPRHTGSVTSRFEFVAVVTRAGEPAPDLTFESCTETEPTPIVGWEPAEPVEGQTVDFLDLSSYADEAMATTWRFDDPKGSSPTEAQHQFSDNGVFTVDFTVTDAGGESHISDAAEVTVKNTPPMLEVVEFGPDGRSIKVSIDDAGVIDRKQLEVRLTSPTPGWPSGGFSAYTSPPTDPMSLEPMLGPWTHTVNLPTTIAPGVYFVVLTVLDKDGGKATATFTLAVPPPAAGGGGGGGQTALQQPASTFATGGSVGSTTFASGFMQATAAPRALTSDTPPAAPVPAFVVDTVAGATGQIVTIVNATRTSGVASSALLDPGDGRPELAMEALGSVSIAYSSADEWPLGVTGVPGTTTAALHVTITGPSIPAGVTYTGVTSAPVGAPAAVAARATGGDDVGLPGVVVQFTLGTESVEAITGSDGVATAALPVTVAAGVHQLQVTPLPSGTPVVVDFTVTPNSVPVADAGGAYTVGAGSPLSLVGSGTDTDPGETATLTYAWDLDGDGQFDDSSAVAPSLTPPQIASLLCGGTCDAGEVSIVALQVTDAKGGRSIDTATVTSIRDFLLTITPSMATLVPNANVGFTVGVVSENGFSGPVALTAPGLPAGVVASFDPPNVTPNGTSLLTIRANATFVAQDFDLVVRGTSGSIVREIGTDLSLEFGLIPTCFGSVSGRVTDQLTGNGVAGISILGAITNAAGEYSATNLALDTNNAPRQLSVSDLGSTYYPISPAATVRIACGVASTLDVSVLRRQYGAVQGTITGVDVNGTSLGPINQATFALNRRTGPDGRYTFANLNLGTANAPTDFSVNVSATGFHTRTASVGISAGTTSTLDITLTKICTGSIRVRVLDQRTGLTVEGARVDLGAGTSGATTDADGIAILPNIGLGSPNNGPTSRTVRAFTPTGVAPQGTASRNVVVGSCGAQAPVDVPIPYPRRVEAPVDVLVIDDAGAPVAGATVRIGSTTYSGLVTGPDGRLSVTHLFGFDVPSTLSTSATASAPGMVTPPAVSITLVEGRRNSVTVTLVVRRFGAFEGIVRDRATGEPLAGITVSGDVTGPDGRYRVENVTLNGVNEPRSFSISANDNRVPPLFWRSPNQTVTVRAGEVTQVPDLLMTRICAPATIRGRVVNAITRQPIEGVRVRAGTPSDLTDADGRFVIENVGVDTDNQNLQYTVIASKTGFVTAQKTVTVSCNADIVVDFGSEGDGTGTISGRVTDTNGNAVAGARVSTGFGGAATTNSTGNYTIANAPVGEGGVARDWAVQVTPAVGSPLNSANATATVTLNGTTVLDFVLTSRAGEPPVAASYAITIEPVPTSVTLGGADPTNDPLTFQVTGGPDHGALSGAPPSLTYTPEVGFAGVDTITFTASDGTNTSAPGTVTITVLATNEPPIARITGALVVDEGTRAQLTGSTSSDPENGTLTYAWDLDDDGLFDDDADANASVRLFDDGVIPVALRVADPRGGFATTTVDVEVRNVAPTLTIEEVILTGPLLELYASVEEPGADVLTGTIDFGDGSGVRPLTTAELNGSSINVDHTYPGAGTYLLVIEVCDDDGGCDTQEESVTIAGGDNLPPVARITGATTADEGDTVTLSAATSSDAGGSIVGYAWDLDGDGAYDDDLDATATVTRNDDGAVTVSLRVTDNALATGTAGTTITFANVAPEFGAVDPIAVGVGGSIDTDVAFLDPGDDTWVATVDWDDDGAPDETSDPSTRTVSLVHQFDQPGTFVVALDVCDDDDGCGTTTVTVVVAGTNQSPIAAIDTPTPADEGALAAFDGGSSTDPDGTIVEWSWDLDGDTAYDDASTPTANRLCLDDGDMTVGLQVTDDDGATSTTTATVACHNVAPTLASLSGAALEPGQSFQQSGTFVDPGLDTWTATVDWGEGDGPEPLAIAAATQPAAFTLDHVYAAPGTFTVTVEVCDDEMGCGSATATVTVTAAPPDPTADLSIDLHHTGDITAGTQAQYTIDVANAGPDAAHGIVVTNTLPAGMTFVTSAGQGWVCSQPAAATVSCTLSGALAAGGASQLVLTVALARSAAAGPDIMTNAASVAATTLDPDSSNNSDDDATTIVAAPPLANLGATISISDPAPYQGDEVMWSVVITNAGPDNSGRVTATIVLPAGVSFVGIAPSATEVFRTDAQPVQDWSCAAAMGVVCSTPGIDPGGSSTLSIRVEVAPLAVGTLTAAVTIVSASDDPDPSDNSLAPSMDVQQVAPSTTATTTTTAPVSPPVTPRRTLPATGSSTSGSVGLAELLLLTGLALLLIVRMRRPTTRGRA